MTIRSKVFAALLVLTSSSAFALYDTHDTCTALGEGCPDMSLGDTSTPGGGRDDRPELEHRDAVRVPPGSYLQSCRQATVDAANLYAQCRKLDGSWANAVLTQYRTCRPGIDNIDGVLRCDHDTAGNPPGSYQLSCRNERVSQGQLLADCRNRAGEYRNARLDVVACKGDISNQDGVLTCPR